MFDGWRMLYKELWGQIVVYGGSGMGKREKGKGRKRAV